MPELPEAESIARALDRALKKRRVAKVKVFFPKLRTSLEPLKTANLEGVRFLGCRRRARYAVADLEDGRALTMHFGMSGVVRVEDASLPRRKHEHVVIELDNGKAFKFEDPRRFGFLEVQRMGADGWPECLSGIGVEPLSPEFTGAFLHGKLRGRKKTVKELLMDNSVVTGIGNIYAAETLFAAKVSPLRPAHSLTLAECRAIVRHAKRILKLAIECGGTTVSDFKNVDGSEGKFVQKLRIYGKKACPKCGSATLRPVLGGRTSWYCPSCQC
jgi:formamidopyrimidine-DNA glycosylase